MHGAAAAVVTSRPYQLIARRVIVPWLLQGERLSGQGLEIGAGSGAMTAQLLTAFPDLTMTATDYGAGMVDKAARTLAPFGDRARAERADATSLPFDDGRFDLVLSAAMLHHVIDWDKALAEAVRVLRPGGLLIGYDLLDTAPIRLMHVGRGHDVRLMRPGQLEARLGRLPVTAVRSRPALGGALLRFTARKAGQGPEADGGP